MPRTFKPVIQGEINKQFAGEPMVLVEISWVDNKWTAYTDRKLSGLDYPYPYIMAIAPFDNWLDPYHYKWDWDDDGQDEPYDQFGPFYWNVGDIVQINMHSDEFDPSLYGMTASYDEDGNYIYPEGFDPETNEWKAGFDEQRIAWEQQYAEAQARWEAHKKQVISAQEAEQNASTAGASASSYGSQPASGEGSLASDEALQALRDKLTGN